MNLSEISQLRDGDPIPVCRVRFKKVGDYKHDTNEHGPWSIQNCEVFDNSGTIKLKLMNRPELTKEWSGVGVIFQATPGTKKPWLGVVKETDTYRNVSKTMIKVDERATMVQDTGQVIAEPQQVQAVQPQLAPAPAAVHPTAPATVQAPAPVAPAPVAPAPVAPVTAPVTPQRPARPEPGSIDDQRECVRRARERVGKMANAIILCFDASRYIAERVEFNTGIKLEVDQLERIAVHLSINLERGNYVDGLPVKPIDEVCPKPQKQTTQTTPPTP